MYKMLIADDNALSLKGLQANLDFSALDAELVGSFLSGMEVVSYLRKHPDVDLVVSDIRMPHMTGLEMAREALSLNSLTKIVLISAYDDFEYAQEALRIGVFDYVQKPIQYDELTSTLQKALRKLDDERRVLKRLEEAQPLLREKFYTDLLHSHPLLAESNLRTQAEYLGIAVHGGAFLCVVISSDFDEPDTCALGAEKAMLQTLGRVESLQHYLGERLDCRLMNEREHILAILHAPGLDGPALSQQVEGLCRAYRDGETGDRLRVCFGIGPAVNCLWEISRSMDAALSAVNRRFIFSDETVFVERAGEDGRMGFITRLSESEAEIVRLLLRRDEAELARMTRLLVESCQPAMSDGMMGVSFLYVLASGILERLDGFNMSKPSRLLLAFGAKARHALGSREILSFLMSFFGLIMEELSESQQSHQQKLIDGVKSYIEANLHDPQLRLEAIAAHAHLNPSHLSRIFKKTENVNVSDYITQKRIRRAERLLLTTDESVSVVSDQVGYSSPYYFSACFKKLAGVTPSEYRKGNGA